MDDARTHHSLICLHGALFICTPSWIPYLCLEHDPLESLYIQAFRRGRTWCVPALCTTPYHANLMHSVVLINSGPSAGKIAVIVEIIDHKRVRYGVLHSLIIFSDSPPIR
jgi:hypothetical protein